MTRQNKNKAIAIAVTVVVHAVVVALLIMMAFTTPLPLPGEAGVEVNLGMYNQGMGMQQQPKPKKVVETPKPQPEPVKEQIVTQDTEEAPALEAPKPKKKEEPKVNERALFKPAKQQEQPSSEGKTETAGDQGKENGNEESVNNEGPGGNGINTSYDLGGRNPIGSLPKPNKDYLTQKGDRICIQIKVNSQGEVEEASYRSKGSTLPNTTQNQPAINAAINAAKQSRWRMRKDDTGILIGTITYFII